MLFTSDLYRAVETATIALGETHVPILHDWRLRECNYGDLNGQSAATVHHKREQYLEAPYPNGESWRQAVNRVGRFLNDVEAGWRGQRVLVIGHVATRWGFDHLLRGVPLETLVGQEFAWQYEIP